MYLKHLNKLIGCLLGVVLVFMAAAPNIYGYELIDTDRTVDLTAVFRPNREKAANVEFKLYKVASVSPECLFSISEPFTKYSISLDNLDNTGWRSLAQTLAGYASADKIPAAVNLRTDSEGEAVFPGLIPGLYLITGSSYTKGRNTYMPAPFLVCLPNYEQNAWQYAVTANVKYNSRYEGGGSSSNTVTRKVLKAWKNDEQDKRPETISVTLFCDGTSYDTVTLNAQNNWRYTWNNLSNNRSWTLVENNVPSGYTASVSQEGITFLLTNTGTNPDNPGPNETPLPSATPDTDRPNNTPNPNETPDPQETNPPGGGDDSNGTENPSKPGETDSPKTSDSPNETLITENPSDPGAPSNPNSPENPLNPNIPSLPGTPETSSGKGNPPKTSGNGKTTEKLPQTGMLWWPVPALSILGIAIFMIGWLKQRTEYEDEQE